MAATSPFRERPSWLCSNFESTRGHRCRRVGNERTALLRSHSRVQRLRLNRCYRPRLALRSSQEIRARIPAQCRSQIALLPSLLAPAP